jgi:hypothetical protein
LIRRTAILALAGLGFATASCATDDVATARTSYTLGRGVVSYDELRRANDQCASEGGKIEVKQDGGDPAQLSNYTCVIPKAGSKAGT